MLTIFDHMGLFFICKREKYCDVFNDVRMDNEVIANPSKEKEIPGIEDRVLLTISSLMLLVNTMPNKRPKKVRMR